MRVSMHVLPRGTALKGAIHTCLAAIDTTHMQWPFTRRTLSARCTEQNRLVVIDTCQLVLFYFVLLSLSATNSALDESDT